MKWVATATMDTRIAAPAVGLVVANVIELLSFGDWPDQQLVNDPMRLPGPPFGIADDAIPLRLERPLPGPAILRVQ
jgi:hypothetical protein